MTPDWLDISDLRPVIIGVAESTLTTRQLEIFVLHLYAGLSASEVGRRLGITQQAVSEAINGGVRSPGIIKKVGNALKHDEDFQRTLSELREPALAKKAKGGDVVGWYRGSRADDFVSLAVLHYANALADKDRRLTVDMLQSHLPPLICTHALTRLRVTGRIMTDGIDITILSTPTIEEPAQ